MANSPDCPKYKDQATRIQDMINQYSSKQSYQGEVWELTKDDFPLIQGATTNSVDMYKSIVDRIVETVTKKMEEIVESTTNKLILTMKKKIDELEKRLQEVEKTGDDNDLTIFFSTDEENPNAPEIISKNLYPRPKSLNQASSTTSKPVMSKILFGKKTISSPAKQNKQSAKTTRKRNRSSTSPRDNEDEVRHQKFDEEEN